MLHNSQLVFSSFTSWIVPTFFLRIILLLPTPFFSWTSFSLLILERMGNMGRSSAHPAFTSSEWRQVYPAFQVDYTGYHSLTFNYWHLCLFSTLHITWRFKESIPLCQPGELHLEHRGRVGRPSICWTESFYTVDSWLLVESYSICFSKTRRKSIMCLFQTVLTGVCQWTCPFMFKSFFVGNLST